MTRQSARVEIRGVTNPVESTLDVLDRARARTRGKLDTRACDAVAVCTHLSGQVRSEEGERRV